MEKAKKRRLERAGWKVGDVSDFLGLEPVMCEESAEVKPARKRYGRHALDERMQRVSADVYGAEPGCGRRRLSCGFELGRQDARW